MRVAARLGSIDALIGLLFIALALVFLVPALTYGFGTMQRIGPGFFPGVVAILLAIVGIGNLVIALRQPGTPPQAIRWRALLPVIAIPAFGLTIAPLGLVAASLITVMIARRAERGPIRIEEPILAIGLALTCYAIFVVGLALPIRLLPAF
ncbi:MAG: tripartite tricarboxylate transporter TctB family protein [Azospirillaceae bacterium]